MFDYCVLVIHLLATVCFLVRCIPFMLSSIGRASFFRYNLAVKAPGITARIPEDFSVLGKS